MRPKLHTFQCFRQAKETLDPQGPFSFWLANNIHPHTAWESKRYGGWYYTYAVSCW